VYPWQKKIRASKQKTATNYTDLPRKKMNWFETKDHLLVQKVAVRKKNPRPRLE
jgi:hypothetical protein